MRISSRSLVVFLSVVLLLGAGQEDDQADGKLDGVTKRLRSVRQGLVVFRSPLGRYGSGVLLDSTHVLSAGHLFNSDVSESVCDTAHFFDEFGKETGESGVQSAVFSEETDLALVTLKTPAPDSAKPISLSKELPVWGQRIFTLGTPVGYVNQVYEGRYNGAPPKKLRGRTVSVFVLPGMSGGPVVNEDGALVGISIVTYQDIWVVGVVAALEDIRAFLEGANGKVHKEKD